LDPHRQKVNILNINRLYIMERDHEGAKLRRAKFEKIEKSWWRISCRFFPHTKCHRITFSKFEDKTCLQVTRLTGACDENRDVTAL
jgi:hypothetical protein